MKRIAMLACAAALCGCASSADEIGPEYVSPLEYQNYTCKQLREESRRVSRRASQLAGQLDDNATDDAIMTGVGVVVFWPALFFIDGDGPEAAEYARLQGEREAIEKAAIKRNCNIEFREQTS